MQKSRRRIFGRVLVTLFIIGIVSYRMIKIVQKEEKKQLFAESVTPSIVWDIKLSPSQFIGDLSQVGSYLLYKNLQKDPRSIQVLRIDNNTITKQEVLDESPSALPDVLTIGRSKLGKKEFRIEYEQGRGVVAQYNIATKARGLIAKLPEHCTEFKTVQRLPYNFFALEALCSSPLNNNQQFKRIMVVDFETRRLTYVSDLMPPDVHFIAFK